MSSDRLAIVAGSPYRADSVPGGISRRSTGRPNAQPSTTSTQPAIVVRAPWPSLAAACAAGLADPLLAEPTARVRPASTRPALTATPIPSVIR